MILTLVAACGSDPRSPPAPDLGLPLDETEARAGLVTDEAWLTGGGSAEGRVGDLLILNDRVRFVLQGLRDGGYYVEQAGGVIDADVVRPSDQPGRDAIDDWMGMFGLGRVVDPTAITVVADGALGGPAIVRVTGTDAPMHLVTGALESEALVPPLGLTITTDYVLQPGSWILELYTTVSIAEGSASLDLGDFAMGGLESLQPWHPGVGFGGPDGDTTTSGYLSFDNDVAYAVVAGPGAVLSDSAGAAVLAELASTIGGFSPTVTVTPDAPATWVRGYAVGPDLATITTAGAAWRGEAIEPVTGVVTAADGPVAGARVHVLVDDAPWTIAISRDDGSFEATVPPGSSVSYLTDARGRGLFRDLDPGAAPWGPYAVAAAGQAALASFVGGASAVPYAQGRSPTDDPLTVGVPAALQVTADDGLPFEVRVTALDPLPELDARIAPDDASGTALGWARDGSVTLALEPGRHQIVVHRGIRHEVVTAEVTVVGGETTELAVALPAAYPTEGWLLGDPHMHAGPSGDGQVRIEDRLLGAAAVGLQLHFGTDHDHVVDYHPPLSALGVEGPLATVVADEVSSVLRGHVNAWPLVSDPAAPSGGALRWWLEIPESTDDLFAAMRSWAGQDVVLQLNHPLDSGVGSAAGWSPGAVSNPDAWTHDFDAVEVMNGGSNAYLEFYLDLVNHGILAAPVGVSDAHGFTDGRVGASATFFGLGVDEPTEVTGAMLQDAARARRTVVTRGPRLDLSLEPGSTVAQGATLDVAARSPSWIVVDRIALWRDGVEIESVTGTAARFTLDPEVDASYVVMASGDTPMAPVWPSDTPWAMAAPILVDVAGDGWTAPSPLF